MNIAIIPARQGSKSIINKNLQKIGPKTLVQSTVESAIRSHIFSKIIISTNIPTIIEEYQGNKKVSVHVRPEHLCTDEAVMLDVIKDVINGYSIDNECIVWLLQPTSPFRDDTDYNKILELFKWGQAKSVISVTNVGASHPNRMYTIKDDKLYPIRFASFNNKQDLPDIFIRSGHYYVFYCSDFLKEGSFYCSPCMALEIPKARAVNIDDKTDLLLAKLLYTEHKCQPA